MVRPEKWSGGLWVEVQRHLESEGPVRHPKTKRFRYPVGGDGREYYLKIYHRSRASGALKDLLRDSRAVRALKQGEALAEFGFQAPLAVAAGEERYLRSLRRAFLLTLAVEAKPLAVALREQFAPPLDLAALRRKRGWLRQLALEVSRLHQWGFVHGDLVPSNILVCNQGGEATFFYMDNDRTRRYPRWIPHLLWTRNLIQLNRFVLPGVSLQDRMRFLRIYLGEKPWGKRERRLIRHLEMRTRKRRKECEHVEAQASFRELMRWNGPFAKSF